jgi:hypothetical protein
MIRGYPDPVHDEEAARAVAAPPHPTDLTDADCQLLAPLIPAPSRAAAQPSMTAAS